MAGGKSTYDGYRIIVSPLIYDIMLARNAYVPDCITYSPMTNDNQILTVPNDVMRFYEDNITKWLKEWCGIPSTSEPLYLHVDKPIPPKASVSLREI